ncbi:24086_t:CDS:1, partial [Gigaspora margarita]
MLSKFYLVLIIALVFTATVINSAPFGRVERGGKERPVNVENKKENKNYQ